MKYSKSPAGFTLIELLLAMTFLSAILLFSTLVFVQALATYNKGVTIKQINETGRAITTDLSRSANGAEQIIISGQAVPQFLCVGQTAYMWNVATNPQAQRIQFGDGTPISMVRTKEGVDARKTTYCSDMGGSTRVVNEADFESLIGTQAQVLEIEVTPRALEDTDISSANVPLVRLELTVGTTSEDGALTPERVVEPLNPDDPYGETVKYWRCPADSIGNFCAAGTYSTTIYLASGA